LGNTFFGVKRLVAVIAMAVIVYGVIGISASAMTYSPYGGSNTCLTQISVTAWFNSGYKTTAADTKYGVKKNAYIKQCWVRIQEGSYDKKVWSEAFTRAEKKQGRASLTCGNNPFYIATATWGWKYN
jgi:hypothetical protein